MKRTAIVLALIGVAGVAVGLLIAKRSRDATQAEADLWAEARGDRATSGQESAGTDAAHEPDEGDEVEIPGEISPDGPDGAPGPDGARGSF